MLSRIVVVLLALVATLAGNATAEEFPQWKTSRNGSYIAVSAPEFFVLFRRDLANNTTFQVVPLYTDVTISIASQRPLTRGDEETVGLYLYNGESGKFTTKDWGGFIGVSGSAGADWSEKARMFRLYADGSIGVMGGKEFVTRFCMSSAGFTTFRRAKYEPQYPDATPFVAPAGKLAAAPTTWGTLKVGAEADTMEELFRE